MELKDIVSISGMGGLFKVQSQRPDGLIVSELGEEKSRFVSNRVHMFTPLEGITLYTYTDNVELAKVLQGIKKLAATEQPPEGKASNDAYRDYLRKVVKDFDEERVYVSDIKKLLKWYVLLDAQGLITEDKPAKEEKPAKKEKADKPEKAEKTEKAAAKPKEEKAPKKPKKTDTDKKK